MKIKVKIIFILSRRFFDIKIPKEVIKEYVKSEKFTNTADIMDARIPETKRKTTERLY